MIKLTHSDIQQVELKILLYFTNFCKEHNLKFYLAGGTLLGAIRHKGFIPWDDDIDVCMPRADYERLNKIFKSDGIYQLTSNQLDNSFFPYANLKNMNTCVKSKYVKQDSQLWIDIFPVDGLPESLDVVKKIYRQCDFYRRIFLLANATLGEGKNTFHKYSKYIIKPFSLLYGKRHCVEKIEQIAQKNSYQDCKYVGIVTWGLYGAGERMLKSEFEKQVLVEFEGYQFPAFSCWDTYLHGLYGDYMQLPPVEKRQTHNMEVYWRDGGK
ncbi:LicD family protein [Acidaminococcus sp. LBK-2]|uniref:LicD family protein n=1 Tax=Acidaminococcus sp. LBK-2 TaxID=3456956 RepID=UPI003FA4123F